MPKKIDRSVSQICGEDMAIQLISLRYKSNSSNHLNSRFPNTVETNMLIAKVYDKLTRFHTTFRSYQMSSSVKVPKGTRDSTPSQTALRNYLFKVIVDTFKKHGAVEIDTPVFELKQTLTDKYGDDSKLIYDLADQGGELLSLRYDLTVPLARYVAMNKIDNIKRFHIAKVYRRDNPSMSRGRFREFYQCDFDICGSYDVPLPDVECCKVVCEIFNKLNIGEFRARINHRKVLNAMMEASGVPDTLHRTCASSIDKMDKTDWLEIRNELISKSIEPESVDQLERFVNFRGGPELVDRLLTTYSDSKLFKEGLLELKSFFEYAKALNILHLIEFDLSLARGLDYYTGMIFEFVMTENGSVGSVAGGGRYDNLIGVFMKKNQIVPAVGISVGVERIMAILEQRLTDDKRPRTKDSDVLVVSPSPNLLNDKLSIATRLWDAEISAEIQYKKKENLLRCFQYCESNHIPFVVIVGDEELKERNVIIKTMSTRDQVVVKIDELVSELKKLIDSK
ncbi:Histidine--tRNA ligase, cytoplasmic [Thelohanellus kitauei]|uniref:Histidine--tRNA ligase, cytoplasmic n=1 Tax=Thelohanellus kitauei TaxID=669202 RepID=A0A0C2NI73_THEKT|nr:Histidine--tRNA ligase, cytoplasmic [Thelohanellus kitauei]